MYFIPFIYFSSLTAYLWVKNKCFSVVVYMSLLYTITSLCSVIMVLGNMLEGSGVLFDGWEPELGFVPTVLYCFLLTLTILPFNYIKSDKLKHIYNVHPLVIIGFCLILVAQALLNFYLIADSTMDILNGDLNDVREAHYNEDMSFADIKAMSLPGVLQYFNYLNYTTILALPLFFYYSCIERKSLWITSVLLFVSLSGPLKAIQAVDRAELILYAEMFLFCLVFFQKVLTNAVKRLMLVVGVPFALIGVVYLVAVSAARFDETNEGTSGSVLQYAGQSYLNFCYFYDNADPSLIYPEREIPIISHVALGSDYGGVKEERSAKEGFFIGVFATHVGAWMLDIGVVGAIVWSILFALLCTLIIMYINRSEFEITEVMMLFILATIPIFGIFYYRFHSFQIALQYLVVGLLFLMSKVKLVWGKKKN